MKNFSNKFALANLFVISAAALITTSCKTPGYVAPVVRTNRVLDINVPPGMVYVPSGTLLYKAEPGDSLSSSEPVRVSLSAFFMDEAEVTNKQYREFVNWVADSVAITDYLNDPTYFLPAEPNSIAKNIDWSKIKREEPLYLSQDAAVQSKLAPMFVIENNKRVLNSELLKYKFTYLQAGGPNAGKFVEEKIPVQPEKGVWAKDFPNSQMEFMVTNYSDHKSFENHPVVGVTWKQARAFTDWRTKSLLNSLGKNSAYKSYQMGFNLPTEAQWQYAELAKRSPEDRDMKAATIATKNDKLAVNFKQNEGKYGADGAMYTLPVKSYTPNSFGLFNMAGNVAEWTLDAFSPSYKEFVHDLNPVLKYDAAATDPDIMKRKVVRGGSWKDPAETVTGTVREFEIQDVPHSYIGFRCVMPAPDVMSKQVKTSLRNKS